MESAEKKRPGDILTGALIGLARTTYSHLKTEDTDRVVTCALSVLARPDAGEEELAQQLKQVRAEKLMIMIWSASGTDRTRCALLRYVCFPG